MKIERQKLLLKLCITFAEQGLSKTKDDITMKYWNVTTKELLKEIKSLRNIVEELSESKCFFLK